MRTCLSKHKQGQDATDQEGLRRDLLRMVKGADPMLGYQDPSLAGLRSASQPTVRAVKGYNTLPKP
jgi:hypothetical protein